MACAIDRLDELGRNHEPASTMHRMKFSFEGRIIAAALLTLGLVSLPMAWLATQLDSWWLGWLIAIVPGIAILSLLLQRMLRPTSRLFAALVDGVASLKDSDFSVSLAERRRDELGELVKAYNELGDVLRTERQSLYQRELLLDTVMQSAPTALVLCNANDRIVYSNAAARHQFTDGKPLNGHGFATILKGGEPAFRQAVASGHHGLFTIEGDEPQTFHLSRNQFALNAQPHQLYLFKQLTHEISRQEVSTWKKVIRLISHELNNSLAPISSLAHSGKLVAETPNTEQLEAIFSTIEERTTHLKHFIEGYARFARLPAPVIEAVEWSHFIGSLQQIQPFQQLGELPTDQAYFDPGQMEQVFINLLKNAKESGSAEDEVSVQVTTTATAVELVVRDRGAGMSENVLKNALLPFYSTKQSGTGLGLPLCREIVEAHQGRISLSNRPNGGLSAKIWLPKQPTQAR